MSCWTGFYRPGKAMGDALLLLCTHTCTIPTRVKYVPVFAFLNVSVTVKIDPDFSTVGSIIESYLKIQSYIRNRTSKIAFQKINPAKCFGCCMH